MPELLGVQQQKTTDQFHRARCPAFEIQSKIAALRRKRTQCLACLADPVTDSSEFLCLESNIVNHRSSTEFRHVRNSGPGGVDGPIYLARDSSGLFVASSAGVLGAIIYDDDILVLSIIDQPGSVPSSARHKRTSSTPAFFSGRVHSSAGRMLNSFLLFTQPELRSGRRLCQLSANMSPTVRRTLPQHLALSIGRRGARVTSSQSSTRGPRGRVLSSPEWNNHAAPRAEQIEGVRDVFLRALCIPPLAAEHQEQLSAALGAEKVLLLDE
ncbi:hypothetical protein HPB50_010585 [Hyalomma asiaticum]|uniref:Uncharacterized protein n=1 Tax=Hyalomma asiaticum TaxID=266040 RepID=A0ACB7RT10_HYAAI|nr:hypothetical protein HPB50_010585 [Hyalomma asiaticum]